MCTGDIKSKVICSSTLINIFFYTFMSPSTTFVKPSCGSELSYSPLYPYPYSVVSRYVTMTTDHQVSTLPDQWPVVSSPPPGQFCTISPNNSAAASPPPPLCNQSVHLKCRYLLGRTEAIMARGDVERG